MNTKSFELFILVGDVCSEMRLGHVEACFQAEGEIFAAVKAVSKHRISGRLLHMYALLKASF